jgi:serine protease Do
MRRLATWSAMGPACWTPRWTAAAAAMLAAMSVALFAFAPPARGDEGTPLVVNCFDEARNVVQKTRRGDCRGRIVSADEAVRIDAARRDYVRRAFNDQRQAVLPGRALKRIGTGFFVDRDGAVLTSRHVVENCEAISVSPTTGDTVAAEIIGFDQINDLALLRTDVSPPGVARFVQGRSPGVAIVGYPDQGIPPIRPLLTIATMIGTETIVPGLTVLKMNADVRPGNSGGPLLDQKGNVVGVVFAEINTPGIYAQTGEIVRNIGFAIPGDVVVAFISRFQIPYWKAGGAAEAGAADLLGQARPYIARIGCWQAEQQGP